jgi:hypothetical protein
MVCQRMMRTDDDRKERPSGYHDGRLQPYVGHAHATLSEYRHGVYCTRFSGQQPGPGTSAHPEPVTTYVWPSSLCLTSVY